MKFVSLLILVLTFSVNLSAKTLDKQDVPKPLKPWVDWVLFDEKKLDCPFIYNNHKSKKCAWPTRLELNISDNRARFSQSWQVFEKTWVSLPGDNKHWPQSVNVNNRPATVTLHNNVPSVLLNKGKYQIKGNFYWESIPESLQIPSESALVNLYIKGIKVTNPEINNQGRLWLADNKNIKQGVETDKLSMNVYRLLDDRIPMRVVTHLDLQVSGSSREINLGQVLLQQQIPVSITSRIPTLLDNNGALRLQVKPGRWTVKITSRAENNILSLGLNEVNSSLWPNNEVWAFQAQNHLRVVKLEGAERIDPRQTHIPESWKKLPTFKMVKDKPLLLKESRRGDQQPQADKLKLNREMWLDFDGKGYTVKDEIKGTVSRSWRLEASSDIELGRVAIDGVPQFITKLSEQAKNKGVEVRRGKLELNADSRYEGDIQNIPASGWLHEFKAVSTVLHLPPGWRVFSATGVDNIPHTWLQKWTLLDLFIVLIIAISIARLWSWGWGVFGLIAMGLIWHESGFVPQYIWLNLLAVIAVLKMIPEGKFKTGLSWYRNFSIILLLLISIPFMVTQVRTGIYPQLEKSWFKPMADTGLRHAPAARKKPALMDQELALEERIPGSSIAKAPLDKIMSYKDKYKRQHVEVQSYDPKANVQTGPGLPQWKWNKVYLNWNGPVHKEQKISLILISPVMHTVLNFLRVIFIGLLCLLMLRSIPSIPIKWMPTVLKLLLLITLVPSLWSYSDNAQAKSETFPDQTILKELKKRLTQPPECLPTCAQIHSMILRADTRQMQLSLNIHALQKVAVPLPARAKQWLPSKVLIDGKTATAMYRALDGVIWLELPKGRFNVLLSGKFDNKKYIQLPLQLKPRIVQSKLKGWSIEGIKENGVPDAQLQLTREQEVTNKATQKFQDEQTEALPPFLIIERHLKFGLDWFVETSVRRISPIGSPVVVNIPLLKGESVLTENIRSKDGQVFINMSPSQSHLFWRSSLEKTGTLKLTAINNDFSTELWSVSVSPIWHMQYSGIPVIKHTSQQGRWTPKWHPWQGEEVTLKITRPKGIAGNTLTIEKSHILVKPGKRTLESQLDLTLRSSQGGQYSLSLPENSNLQSVKINHAAQSIRMENNNITLPITPGKQSIQIIWRNATPLQSMFTTPKVDLKQKSVNHSINVKFARDRWVLLVGGPDLGPAVLFWGILIVILILAIGLGFTSVTPLNTLSWLLLGIGLSQVPIWMSFIVVAWLFVLAMRKRMIEKASKTVFNIIQIGIGGLTFFALICLFVVIQQGLLGSPDMQVAGNGSSVFNFNWYQDRNIAQLPQAWLLSVPTLVYRLLMLAWALWLAFSLLRWIKWGWQQFSIGGIWRDVSPKPKDEQNRIAQSDSDDVPRIEEKGEREE